MASFQVSTKEKTDELSRAKEKRDWCLESEEGVGRWEGREPVSERML